MQNMAILGLVCILLSIMPLLVVVLFRSQMVNHKKKELENEIKKLNGENCSLVKDRRGISRVNDLIDDHYRWRTLLVPAIICSALYLVGFVLCLNRIQVGDPTAGSRLFPGRVLGASLLLYTFLGTYLFNAGALVRRVYLMDLNENVFCAAIYRLLLSLGLAIALLPFKFTEHTELVFFAIGFLANAFLEWVLVLAMKAADLRTEQREDFSLRMVRGINIWKDFRLEEEGIENVQNLATADVIELAVKTHYSLRTLIDWVDQAMVVSRFGLKTKDLEAAGLNISAIEMACLAPQVNDGNIDFAKAITDAGKLNLEFVKAQLKSLYEDAFVRELWTLWQTKEEYPEKSTVAASASASASPVPAGAPQQQALSATAGS